MKLVSHECASPLSAAGLFFMASPILALTAALAAWNALPQGESIVLLDLEYALLYAYAMAGLAGYAVLLVG